MEFLQHGGAVLTSIIAAFTSLLLGVLTHVRAKAAHKDEVAVDRAKMIQDAYQEILNELRGELDRRTKLQDQMRARITQLEEQLIEEIGKREQLEQRLQDIERDVK